MPLDKKRVRKPIEEFLRKFAGFILVCGVWAQTIDNDGKFVASKTTDY